MASRAHRETVCTEKPWWTVPDNFVAPNVFYMDEELEERIFGEWFLGTSSPLTPILLFPASNLALLFHPVCPLPRKTAPQEVLGAYECPTSHLSCTQAPGTLTFAA